MTFDLGKESETATMPLYRAKSSRFLHLASHVSGDGGEEVSCSSSIYSSNSRRKLFMSSPTSQTATCAKANYSSSSFPSASLLILLVIFVVTLCDLTTPVHSSPLPSSSAWSLPTLNYLFKDTKTRSQSNQYKRENNGQGGIGGSHHHHHYHQQQPKANINNLQSSSSFPPENDGSLLVHDGGSSNGISSNNEEGNKVSSTGRLISAHDIRLTDNWGWVRRGASDPQTTTEQRRKQNIRHSKSKHRQRHHLSPSASSASMTGVGGSSSGSSGSRGRKKEKTENLLCPFDEIRGPDGKCRKAPRFSLYRVGRK